MNLPYREGLVKNRYVGRTFIMPDQRMREMSVRRKLNAMPAVFEGKNVLLIDDSIVRGTTMAQIVDMVRKAGAKKVCILAFANNNSANINSAALFPAQRSHHMLPIRMTWQLLHMTTANHSSATVQRLGDAIEEGQLSAVL